MHNAAFNALGMNAAYSAYDVSEEALAGFLNDIPKSGISGLNVTIPHKIRTKEYLEKAGSLDANALKLGAVNTIKASRDGVLNGFNTDGPGFYRSLIEDLKFEPEGKVVTVIGAGGASRAVVMYLGSGPKKINISDIDEDKVSDLKRQFEEFYDGNRIASVKAHDLKYAVDESALLINATPVGMRDSDPMPVDISMLHKGLYVYDLVYNRPATALVKEATRMKLHAVTGIGMLLYQGAISFEIWTGRKAPVDIMRKALKAALKGG
jgi:shikimate dehydrogenase